MKFRKNIKQDLENEVLLKILKYILIAISKENDISEETDESSEIQDDK